MHSGPANNIRSVAPECNRHPGFQRSEPPAPTEKASLTTCKNHKARTCLSRPIPATPFQHFFTDAERLPSPTVDFGKDVLAVEFTTKLPWVISKRP
jgi:hypothetical protein